MAENHIASNLDFLQEKINQNQTDVNLLKKKLEGLSNFYWGDNIHRDKYNALTRDALSAVVHAEKTLLSARNLFNTINDDGYEKLVYEYSEAEANALDIKVGYTEDGWVYVSFPALLPKTGKYVNREFFTPLFYALRYFNKKDFRFMEKTVICITQFYAEDFPPARVKDNDNLELKAVLDCVARTFLVDDGPDYCNMYVSSLKATTSFTEVYIVPEREFTKWIEKHRICPSEAPKLYDKRPKNKGNL